MGGAHNRWRKHVPGQEKLCHNIQTKCQTALFVINTVSRFVVHLLSRYVVLFFFFCELLRLTQAGYCICVLTGSNVLKMHITM